jgi:hypothetical protein
MPEAGAPYFQPCQEREQLIKKAASARREHDELRRKPGMLTGTAEYRAADERARVALQEAEMAVHEYLDHVREHGCLKA